MDEKKYLKVSLGTVVCMFIIFILIVALIAVYYLGFVKNSQKIADLTNKIDSLNNKNTIIQNEKTEIKNDNTNNIETSTNIESKDISVVDAVNYVDSYSKKFKVKLPRIVGNTITIENLNLKILNEVLPSTYIHVAAHLASANTEYVFMDKGSTFDYSYVIKNDVLIIHIYSTVPEGGTTLSASGDGLNSYSYYYDITNDKILSVSEVSDKLNLSLDGLKTSEGNSLTSYSELEKNGYTIIINNNELKLKADPLF